MTRMERPTTVIYSSSNYRNLSHEVFFRAPPTVRVSNCLSDFHGTWFPKTVFQNVRIGTLLPPYKQEEGTVMHICNPSILEDETRKWQLRVQLRLLGETLSSLSPFPKMFTFKGGREEMGEARPCHTVQLSYICRKKPSIHKLSYAAVLTLTKETTLTFLPSWNTMDAHLSWVYTGWRLLHRLTFAHVWWGPLLPSSQWNGGRKRNPLVSPASWQCYIHSGLNVFESWVSHA